MTCKNDLDYISPAARADEDEVTHHQEHQTGHRGQHNTHLEHAGGDGRHKGAHGLQGRPVVQLLALRRQRAGLLARALQRVQERLETQPLRLLRAQRTADVSDVPDAQSSWVASPAPELPVRCKATVQSGRACTKLPSARTRTHARAHAPGCSTPSFLAPPAMAGLRCTLPVTRMFRHPASLALPGLK